MLMDFSVVVPTFQRPKALRDAVSSVLNQSGVSVEVIVVDDSPEDSAREVIESINDRRITYIKNPIPTGGIPSIVRNFGWPRAKGSFVHFLDDDDVVPDGYYAVVKDQFFKNPKVGIIFGRVEPIGSGPDSQLKHERVYFADAASKAAKCRRFGLRWAFVGRMLFDKALLVCSASILRRECVADLGGFDPAIRLMEDADFHVRAIRRFGAHFIDHVSVKYSVGSPSLMHSPNPPKGQIELQREGHRRMHAKYLAQRGALEFFMLAIFTRTILRII